MLQSTKSNTSISCYKSIKIWNYPQQNALKNINESYINQLKSNKTIHGLVYDWSWIKI